MKAGSLARKLEKLGLRSRFDYVLHLPIRYEDETRLAVPGDLAPTQPVLVDAKVLRAEVAYRPRRQLIVHALWCGAQDGGEPPLVLRFFNFYPSQLRQFQRAIDEDLRVRAFGELRAGWFGAEMAHPRYRLVEPGAALPTSLTPVYSSTAGVAQALLRERVLRALDEAAIDDTLGEALRRRYRLDGFEESVRALHCPAPSADRQGLANRSTSAWRRVKFDELLAQQLSMRLAYRTRRARTAPELMTDGPLLRRFLSRLPFRLTQAQERVLAEILADLSLPHPMQRLLQGDVGSGKTIVAALACLAALDSGWQATVMAPTEILAEQHLRKFGAWLEPLGVRLVWLHGGMRAKARRASLASIAAGEPAIPIGTHALFQDDVAFARLGLVVVDEQHRFGVQQRLQLRQKGGEIVPHQLMMSATPIPRTLSMSYYADLDVSVIDTLPPGRLPVSTRLVSSARRNDVLMRVREACAGGTQAYWVCPVIEESKDGELRTATDTYASLVHELHGLHVGLLHGRLAATEKARVMDLFARGELQVLVATTVIEVGVDVPSATLMVIEHAERFGLAQLHQLRGRVGRGKEGGACILLYERKLSDTARARLKVIYEHNDGFEIAREDLRLRGPGEFLGERQSGAPLLRFADPVTDEPLLRAAREAADRMLRDEPDRAARHLERWLGPRHEYARV